MVNLNKIIIITIKYYNKYFQYFNKIVAPLPQKQFIRVKLAVSFSLLFK